MFRAGDEFMNTQGGNNNPWNQDNETTWLDWGRLEKHRGRVPLLQRHDCLSQAHPYLGRSRFWREDVSWYGVDGQVDLSYFSHTLAFCVHGTSQQDRDIYVMINAYWEDMNFRIQEGDANDWMRVADTGRPSPFDLLDIGSAEPLASLDYKVKAESVVVLLRSA